MDISKLLEFDRLAREDGRKFTKKRFFFKEISGFKGRHFLGIAGPRGAGKTVILKQVLNEIPDCFYLSLDTVRDDLFEVVKELRENLNVKTFLLDEIHFHPNYEEGLKKIYDFLDVRVIFTSSAALSLFASSYDLSRRVLIKELYPFSFREYLYFKHNVEIPSITMDVLVDKKWSREVFSYAGKFDSYIKGGNLPFSLETFEPIPLLKNIVNTVVRKDIPAIAKITIQEIETILRLLEFVARSSVDGINYSSLSRNLGVTKYKAEQYVSLLERAFILSRVMPGGSNVMKEPKILMFVPYRLIYENFDRALGALREEFFVETMASLGKKICYLKSSRGAKTPDYLLAEDDIVFEIGGKGKGRRQFKGVKEKKKIILTHSTEITGMKRPLFLIGLI